MNCVLEKFDSIYELDRVISARHNNSIFRRQSSDQGDDSGDWSHCGSYAEARTLLQKGYKESCEIMKRELEIFKTSVNVHRNKQIKDVYGYAPVVANAIKGYPKAMLRTEKKEIVRKQRTYHFLFTNEDNCGTSAESISKAGITLLKLCYILDINGVKTKIDTTCNFSREDNDIYCCLIRIKDYRQPFNLMKMSYPISHPAFFRRQGFKAIETASGLKETDWNFGYGHSIGSVGGEDEVIKDFFHTTKLDKDNFIYINYYDVQDADFDVYKLAERKGIILPK